MQKIPLFKRNDYSCEHCGAKPKYFLHIYDPAQKKVVKNPYCSVCAHIVACRRIDNPYGR